MLPFYVRFNEDHASKNFDDFEEISDLQAMEANEYLVDGFSNISIAYAAYMIDRRIDSRFMYCTCCSDIFSVNKKISDASIGIVSAKNPCASTYYICKIADRYFNAYNPNEKKTI